MVARVPKNSHMSQNRPMRYLGSKGSVVEQVLDLIGTYVPSGSLCDPFGGIGTVGAAAKHRGYTVSAGDQLSFAHAFQVARIEIDRRPAFKKLRVLGLVGAADIQNHLDALPPRDGWVVREYARKRRFFSQANAERIEAVRLEIAAWSAAGLLSAREDKVLRASLVDCADRVANTAGTYYAYLKTWHRKALKPFAFRLLDPTPGGAGCEAKIIGAQGLATSRRWDVLYLDPPFNGRNYARYYHFPESLSLGVASEVRGRAGMPVRAFPRSPFYSKASAETALGTLIAEADCRLIALHYAPNGIISSGGITRELKRRGSVQRYALTARGYTTKQSPRQVAHDLYLVHV